MKRRHSCLLLIRRGTCFFHRSSVATWLEVEFVANRSNAGFGADFVGVTAWRTRDSDRSHEGAIRFDGDAATDGHDTGKVPHARSSLTWLGGAGKARGIEFEGHGGISLVDRSIDGVRAGKAVAQHHQGVACPVIDRYGGLMAVFAAGFQ